MKPLPTTLLGQFMFWTENPLRKFGFQSDPNKVFLSELDTIYERDPENALRIAKEYVAAGFNCFPPCGPLLANGYNQDKNEYPAIDWRQRPDLLVGFLRMINDVGGFTTLVACPTDPPYWSGRLNEPDGKWDVEALERDLGPIYRLPEVQALVQRVWIAWEWWSTTDNMIAVAKWVRSCFPKARIFWHNAPNHLSPCLSTEDEQAAHRAIAPYIDGLAIQHNPPNSDHFACGGKTCPNPDHPDDPQLTPIELAEYESTDMRKRYRGQGNWGSEPILGFTGEPLEVEESEYLASAQYYGGETWRFAGKQWGDALRAAGSAVALDGSV